MRRYHGGERTDEARALMIAEIHTVVGFLLELNLPEGATERGILGPMDDYLLARYGHEVGRRLNAEFLDAFEEVGMPLLTRRENADSRPIHANRR